MKRLHQQQSAEQKTLGDLVSLFNAFVKLNGDIKEEFTNVFVIRKDKIYLASGIANHQYLRGVWCLFYAVSSDIELSKVLYTGIDDQGLSYFNPVTQLTKVYDLCKATL